MLRNTKGFTLIELLLSLALLVILSGALYGTFFSVTKAREKGAASMEARRQVSSTLGMLRREIASSFYAGLSGNQRLAFVVEDRDVYGKPTSFIGFTCTAPPRVDAAPGSDMMAVQYVVKEKDGDLTLHRESKDLYLHINGSMPYPVVDHVESFLVECYDGSKWVKSWDTQLNTRLPDMVRVTLALKGGESFSVIATPGLTRKGGGSIPSIPGLSGGSLSNLPGSGGSGSLAGSSGLGSGSSAAPASGAGQ